MYTKTEQDKFYEKMSIALDVHEAIHKALAPKKKLKKPSKYNPDGSFTDEYIAYLSAQEDTVK